MNRNHFYDINELLIYLFIEEQQQKNNKFKNFLICNQITFEDENKYN